MTQTGLAIEPRADDEDLAAQKNERRRFRSALFLSGLTHTAILVLLFLLWQPATDETVPLPPIPVTIVHEQEGQSGASGGGSGTTAASTPSHASEAASASAGAPSTPEPSTAAPQPAQPPSDQLPLPRLQPQTFSAIPNLAQTTAPAPAPQAAAEPVPPRKPTPPRPKPPEPIKTAQAPPRPAPPTPQPVQQPAAQAPAQNAANTTVPASTEDLLREGVGGRGRGDEGPGRAAVGNGSLEGPGDDYLEAVRRWISRYKKYPPEALDKKQEGVATLGFVIDRGGNVLDAWIDKSSGNPLLDQATLAMIHAASPVPKPPDRYTGATLRLFMPVNYQIGLFDKLFR